MDLLIVMIFSFLGFLSSGELGQYFRVTVISFEELKLLRDLGGQGF